MAFEQLTEEDLKRLAEEEYYRLENKFQLSEVKQQSYPNKVKAILCQQETVLNILEKDKKELITNIDASTAKKYETKEEQGLSQIYVSIEQEKKLDDDICSERAQIKDLMTEIDKVKKAIVTFNKTDVHETKITERIFKMERKVGDLEEKLQVATQRFSQMLAQNSIYRKEIEGLLIERKNFFKSYMALYRQLQHGKQIMLDLVEQATSTYDQREEAIKKLNSLKDKTRAEKRIQSKDVQDLKRKLENTEALYQFLAVKGQKRVLAELEAREAREKKRLREEMEDKIVKYVKLLNKIRNLSDEQNIDKFITRYLKSEDENMGLFNYVNEVNDEVEILQVQVTSLLDRIDDQRALNEKRGREQVELIECITEKVAEKQIAYDKSIRTLNTSEGILNDLLLNIERMFQEFECESYPVIALLGNNAHVNVYNVILCLRLLENQMYEFIYITYGKEKNIPPEELLQGSIVQADYHLLASKRPLIYHLASMSPCPLCVEVDRIFVLDENNEADSLEEHSFVHSQLKIKVEGPDMESVLHNISACRLPRSRAIMQARFQEQD